MCEITISCINCNCLCVYKFCDIEYVAKQKQLNGITKHRIVLT